MCSTPAGPTDRSCASILCSSLLPANLLTTRPTLRCQTLSVRSQAQLSLASPRVRGSRGAKPSSGVSYLRLGR
jgi:hypothetical protein